MSTIQLSVGDFSQSVPSVPVTFSRDDYTWESFIEFAATQIGLVYNPSMYILSSKEDGTYAYLTSLDELQPNSEIYVYEYLEGKELGSTPSSARSPALTPRDDDDFVPPPPPEDDDMPPPPPPMRVFPAAPLPPIPKKMPKATWVAIRPDTPKATGKKKGSFVLTRSTPTNDAPPSPPHSDRAISPTAAESTKETTPEPTTPTVGGWAKVRPSGAGQKLDIRQSGNASMSLTPLQSPPSPSPTPARTPIPAPTQTVQPQPITRSDTFFVSAFQKPDNSHVLLEFDFSLLLIRRWKKEKPLPAIYFYEFAAAAGSAEGSSYIVTITTKTQAPIILEVLSEKEMEMLVTLGIAIQKKVFTELYKLVPSICIKKGNVDLLKKSLIKKSGSMYIVITEKKIFCFASENLSLPLLVIDLYGATVTKRKALEIVIDCKTLKQIVFTFYIEPMRDFWYDSIMKAVEMTPATMNNLLDKMSEIRKYYGLAYDNNNPEHVALLKELWDLTVELSGRTNLEFSRSSTHWKDIGFQRDDPISDLRAVGVLGLVHLIYLAKNYPDIFKEQVAKQNRSDAADMYPFATVGINITQLLIEIFSLNVQDKAPPLPLTEVYPIFICHPKGFEELYCITFRLFDKIWLEMMVGYMGFTKVIATLKDRLIELLQRPPVHGVPAIFDMLGVILDQ